MRDRLVDSLRDNLNSYCSEEQLRQIWNTFNELNDTPEDKVYKNDNEGLHAIFGDKADYTEIIAAANSGCYNENDDYVQLNNGDLNTDSSMSYFNADENGIADLGENLSISSSKLKSILQKAGLSSSEISDIMDEDEDED